MQRGLGGWDEAPRCQLLVQKVILLQTQIFANLPPHCMSSVVGYLNILSGSSNEWLRIFMDFDSVWSPRTTTTSIKRSIQEHSSRIECPPCFVPCKHPSWHCTRQSGQRLWLDPNQNWNFGAINVSPISFLFISTKIDWNSVKVPYLQLSPAI